MTTYVNPERLWFTSDTHFFHTNIIRYENRRYANVQKMNEHYVRLWNQYVEPGDTVYHLGDFALAPKPLLIEIKNQLNGKIHLIMGNHDRFTKRFYSGHFESVNQIKKINVLIDDGEEVRFALCHYPMYSWPSKSKGSYHLFGHVHSRYVQIPNRPYTLNVGWDIHKRPISAAQIATFMYRAEVENSQA